MSAGMDGQVARAVAAVEQAPEARATVQVTLGNGMAIVINVPVDLGTAELLALTHYLTGPEFPARLAEASGARRRPTILVPAHHPLRG